MRFEKSLRANPPRTTVRIEVPSDFVGFCAWLGITLTPGQAEFARVAFDGLEPVDGDISGRLFGADVSVGRRSVVAAVCGARAGKSYVLVALRLLHGMLVRDVSKVPPGPKAAALIIAPRDDLRMEVFRYARGAVEKKPELKAMLRTDTSDVFSLLRPDGYEVEFKTGVATSGGTAARGQWWTDFAMDECAFFRGSTYKINDDEIYKAGSARVLPGGQTILASTPWAEDGLLYEMWKSRPDFARVAHAPTSVLHDSPLTRDIIARARITDADNARREFDAVFMTGGTTVFFESMLLDGTETSEPFELRPGDQVAAGADLGFRSDSSALVLVARRGDTLHLFDGIECRPEEGKPLSLEETFEKFRKILMARRCGYVLADQHFRDAMFEALGKHDIAVAPAQQTPADRYVRARVLLRAGRVKIHGIEFRDRLMRQLREVHGKPTSGGGMSIQHPRWATGGHGDIADAFVLALWQLGGDTVAADKPTMGTTEWEAAAQEERRQRALAERQVAKTDWRARYGLR